MAWADTMPLTNGFGIATEGGRVVAAVALDDSGSGSLANVPMGAEIHVTQGLQQLWTGHLGADSNSISVVLETDSSIGGFVSINSRPPGTPFEFAHEDLAVVQDAGIDGPVERALLAVRDSAGRPRVRTDSEGRFRFAVPHQAGPLELKFPLGYEYSGAPGNERLQAPASGVILNLRAGPAVTGTAVGIDGEPVVDALATYELTCASAQIQGHTPTNLDGRFRIPLMCGPVSGAEVTLQRAGVGWAFRQVAVDPLAGNELGEIPLLPERSVEFRLTDIEQTPIRNARVSAGSSLRGETDHEGRVRLERLPLVEVPIRFEALGFERQHLPLPADVQGAIDVTMKRSTNLTVSFRTSDGQPAPGVRLKVAGEQVFFDGTPSPDAVQVQLGASPVGFAVHKTDPRQQTSIVETRVLSDSSGVVLLTGLATWTPLGLSATDSSNMELPWAADITLTDGEQATLEVTVPAAVGRLHGTVRGIGGQPAAGALVRILGGYSRPLSCSSEGGAFRSDLLHSPSVDVVVTAPGFTTQVISGAQVGESLDIQLDRGRRFIIGIRNQEGAVCRVDGVVLARSGQVIGQGRALADGTFALEHAPSTFETGDSLTASLNGSRLELDLGELHADGAPCWFTSGPGGKLVAEWSSMANSVTEGAIRVSPESENGSGSWKPLSAAELASGTADLGMAWEGRYRLQLILELRDGSEVVTRPQTVEVVPGAAVKATLEL